ncbi:hypothetical protein AA0119_g6068 [Alternaria tenuissima]|jgi:hypothetical protein|uniref:Uncharacterized protein n=2 Tax=Alternaria alternata complex TaxID=187734 RepID=A0A4Q4NDB4_ALTAL|nr:hypothetical protein AA0115_g5793 [Alternaria tenuissima]RYN74473.1 hypothetical protein AA0117_g6916 [Alternaria alternata]RYN56625.1 hypothetical protein AA0114_g2958 [Alternaria tenuissima]RYN64596.1 hypothetical protein AA0118_g3753 [Alternaria tenuissima]RYN86883.1 hypothetical protein AA0120_g7932 [Alternaria tenuissima]
MSGTNAGEYFMKLCWWAESGRDLEDLEVADESLKIW